MAAVAVKYNGDSDYDEAYLDDLALDERYEPQNTKGKNKQKKNGGQQRKKSLTNSSVKQVNGISKQLLPAEQPSAAKTSEFLAEDQVAKAKADAKLRRRSQSGSLETDIEEELANLVKEMTLTSKSVLYYGWFFSETISESLRKLTQNFLKECLEVQQFQRWMATNCELKEVEDPMEYYRKSKKRSSDKRLHVTAKFCNHEPCSPYSEMVQEVLGTEFKLAIIGLYFTDRTCGLRIKLNQEQYILFDDERKSGRKSSSAQEAEGTPDSDPVVITKPVLKHSYSVEDTKLIKPHHSKEYPGISFLPQRENFEPYPSRAHVTVGCAPRVKAYKAGEDLLDIIDLESRSTTLYHDYKIPSGTLRQFGRHGEYTYVVYPQNRVFARSVFMPFPFA